MDTEMLPYSPDDPEPSIRQILDSPTVDIVLVLDNQESPTYLLRIFTTEAWPPWACGIDADQPDKIFELLREIGLEQGLIDTMLSVCGERLRLECDFQDLMRTVCNDANRRCSAVRPATEEEACRICGMFSSVFYVTVPPTETTLSE